MLIRYYLIRCLLFPFAFLPHAVTWLCGKVLGNLCYVLLTKWRKRAFSNLCLAKDLQLNEKQMRRVTRHSFENLAITALEYPLFARTKHLDRYVQCLNPEVAAAIIHKGQGIVFFVGHQANWELLFLEGTRRMPGIAIGRPTKNLYLYRWIRSIRERFGGVIVEPHRGIGKGLRALREGKFMGIVGDQALPGGHRGQFLGCPCWTSPAPALLAQKTGSPLIVASIFRVKGKYQIHYSDPIWPENRSVDELMDMTLALFESGVKRCPEQWLWQHNRFKQEDSSRVYYRYRHDTVLAVVPNDSQVYSQAQVLRRIYPDAFLKFCTDLSEINNRYLYKFVIDLKGDPSIKRLCALNRLTLKDLNPNLPLQEALVKKLCRKTASI